MNPSTSDLRQTIALFRYGLIAPLLNLPPRSAELRRQLAAITAATQTIPGSRRIRVAPGTLRQWLRLYRQGGFEALTPALSR